MNQYDATQHDWTVWQSEDGDTMAMYRSNQHVTNPLAVKYAEFGGVTELEAHLLLEALILMRTNKEQLLRATAHAFMMGALGEQEECQDRPPGASLVGLSIANVVRHEADQIRNKTRPASIPRNTSFILDRSRWIRGVDGLDENMTRRLAMPDLRQDVIGQFAASRGVPLAVLAQYSVLSEVPDIDKNERLTWLFTHQFPSNALLDSDDAIELYRLNDVDGLSDEKRLLAMTAIFATHGVQLVVTDPKWGQI